MKMENLLTLNSNDFEPQDYTIRKVVRCVVINETGTKVLFFGSHFVGGGVEEGETDEEAVAREAMEEVGMRLEIIKPLGEVIAYRDFLQKKYVSHGYLCKQIGDAVAPTTTDPEEQGNTGAWFEIEAAVKKLETEIAELKAQYPVLNSESGQRKIYNRQTSLAYLKKIYNT